jgi:hypothetical protein
MKALNLSTCVDDHTRIAVSRLTRYSDDRSRLKRPAIVQTDQVRIILTRQ